MTKLSLEYINSMEMVKIRLSDLVFIIVERTVLQKNDDVKLRWAHYYQHFMR